MVHRSKVVVLMVIALLMSCATTPAGVQRTPIEQAKLTYANTSIAYEAGLDSIVAARAVRRVTDEQWAAVDKAQRIVQLTTPRWRAFLTLWESSGSQPPGYEDVVAQVLEAVRTISLVATEVKR